MEQGVSCCADLASGGLSEDRTVELAAVLPVPRARLFVAAPRRVVVAAVLYLIAAVLCTLLAVAVRGWRPLLLSAGRLVARPT